MQTSSLVSALSPPLDQQLLLALFQEFISLERRFVLCDWEPATLDGGQLGVQFGQGMGQDCRVARMSDRVTLYHIPHE